MTDTRAQEVAAKLTKAQRAVIVHALGAYDDFGYYNFRDAGERAGISARDAADAIRGLRSLGLVVFSRGLMTEDGEVYGSGYALNTEGLEVRRILQEQEHAQ